MELARMELTDPIYGVAPPNEDDGLTGFAVILARMVRLSESKI